MKDGATPRDRHSARPRLRVVERERRVRVVDRRLPATDPNVRGRAVRVDDSRRLRGQRLGVEADGLLGAILACVRPRFPSRTDALRGRAAASAASPLASVWGSAGESRETRSPTSYTTSARRRVVASPPDARARHLEGTASTRRAGRALRLRFASFFSRSAFAAASASAAMASRSLRPLRWRANGQSRSGLTAASSLLELGMQRAQSEAK